jgi:hypothetical protein
MAPGDLDQLRRCPGVSRRSFLADTGMGFTGLALGAMMARDGAARDPDGAGETPPLQPKAKAVIWIFLCGGVSHVESFDPKPELNRYAGKSIDATPSSARSGPPTTITAPSSSSTQAGTSARVPIRPSAHGSLTDWARSTKTCRNTSSWASRPVIVAAARGHTGRPTWAPSTPACGSTPRPRNRSPSSPLDPA